MGRGRKDSTENGKSVNEPLASNLPQARMPPWRTAAQRISGAQEARRVYSYSPEIQRAKADQRNDSAKSSVVIQ
ncbi:ephexin-1-like protein [Cricetulus griseus]|nr:ephexin-1-like protein [Cricetulus griseus]